MSELEYFGTSSSPRRAKSVPSHGHTRTSISDQ